MFVIVILMSVLNLYWTCRAKVTPVCVCLLVGLQSGTTVYESINNTKLGKKIVVIQLHSWDVA